MKNLLDEDLARAAQQGDDDAFAELVHRYERQIFSMAYRLAGDYDEAADLCGFIVCWTDTTRKKSSSPGCIGWLKTAA